MAFDIKIHHHYYHKCQSCFISLPHVYIWADHFFWMMVYLSGGYQPNVLVHGLHELQQHSIHILLVGKEPLELLTADDTQPFSFPNKYIIIILYHHKSCNKCKTRPHIIFYYWIYLQPPYFLFLLLLISFHLTVYSLQTYIKLKE